VGDVLADPIIDFLVVLRQEEPQVILEEDFTVTQD
jgi:hypothetical protein